MSLLEVEGLHKSFGGGWLGAGRREQAVREVSFALAEGETLAIVGESGSGKSTTARLAMRLITPDAGAIRWNGEDVTHLSGRALRLRRGFIQMVFQDPFASLNPRMRIWKSVAEGLRVREPGLSRAALRERVAEALTRCGMDAASMDRWPHQFSGGQRQRIGIARALIVRPRVLVLDEPVSALDVSVQAQILNLLTDIQRETGMAYLFISHDLSVVRRIADRALVMFAGRVVESAPVAALFDAPRHPYSKALLDARPILHPAMRDREAALPPADEGVAESGCAFRLRCPRAAEDCAGFDGALREEGARAFACLHPLEASE